jgi:hypothetical protein
MEADKCSGFLVRPIRSRIMEADLIQRQISEADFNMEADIGGRFNTEADR